MTTPTPLRSARPLLLAALLTAAPSAHAQNALGDGTGLMNPLDATPAQRARAFAPRSFADELRFRNSIVNGTAPAGMSFRGEVGSTDPFAFRGDLGSNELYEFRRDSAFSGLGGMGIRGTDALQFQFALTTGQSVPSGLARSFSVPRAGTGVSSGDLIARPADPNTPTVPTHLLGSPVAQVTGLRSTASYLTDRDLQPELLQTFRDRAGARFGVTASTLGGIRLQEQTHTDIIDPGFRARMNDERYAAPVEIQRPRPELAVSRAVTPYDALSRRLGEAAQIARPEVAPRTAPGATPGQAPPARPDEPATGQDEGAEPQRPWWEQSLETLRSELDAAEREVLAREVDAADDDAPPTPEELERQARERPVFDAEALRLIREARGSVATLVPEVDQFDAYAAHMQAAEQLVAEARYFDAEERFTSALAARPGDPVARIGRIHAQIGAGLMLSGGQNLRVLLREHPELSGMRFELALLPPAERLDEVEQLMLEQLGVVGPVANEAALLLAYLGYQRERPGQVRRALDWLAAEVVPDAGGRPIAKTPDPIADFLRQIWLDAPPAGERVDPADLGKEAPGAGEDGSPE